MKDEKMQQLMHVLNNLKNELQKMVEKDSHRQKDIEKLIESNSTLKKENNELKASLKNLSVLETQNHMLTLEMEKLKESFTKSIKQLTKEKND